MSQSDEIGKLADLHQRGALTDEEFARAKHHVLNSAATADSPAMRAVNAWQRSASDRWVGGVCGGIAKITGLPSWIWRLFFTIFFLLGGTGILIYVLLWIFIPLAPSGIDANQPAV